MRRTRHKPKQKPDIPKEVNKRKIINDLLILLLSATLLALAIWKFDNHRLEIGLAGGLIIFAWLLWKILSLYLNANEFSERKDFIDLQAKILGSVALVVSLLFTWQGIKNNQVASISILQSTEKRQIEDRYNKALEQLGSDKKGLSLVALYSLGKIASDSILLDERLKTSKDTTSSQDFRDLHWEITQTLASYIRANASLTLSEGIKPRESRLIPPEVQAALSVLAWRNRYYLQGENQRLELYGTDLRGLVLKDKEPLQGQTKRPRPNLDGAQLYKVNLQDAEFIGISLKEAILADADLKNVVFLNADLTDAQLLRADIEGADFRGAIGLTTDQIGLAKNWEKAKNLPPDIVKELKEITNTK